MAISEEKLKEISEKESGSFLAFLYRIRFDPEIAAAFKESGSGQSIPDLNPVAEAFSLSHPAYSKILNDLHRFYYPDGYPDYGSGYVGNYALRGLAVKEADELWTQLVALLVPEFRTFSEGVIPNFPFRKPSDPPTEAVVIEAIKVSNGAPPSWW